MTPQEILALPMQENDVRAKTIKEYLKRLLAQLWIEQEGFSGKRPFGNSGWEFDLYKALIRAGAATGKLDGDGCVDEMPQESQQQADEIILKAIQNL